MIYDTQRAKKIGENIIKKYFKSMNYVLLQKNYRCEAGKIDYITMEEPNEKIVFISVAIRTELYERYRDDFNKKRGIKNTKNAMNEYIKEVGLKTKNTRLDRIEIFIYRGRYKINHIKKVS